METLPSVPDLMPLVDPNVDAGSAPGGKHYWVHIPFHGSPLEGPSSGNADLHKNQEPTWCPGQWNG